MRTRALHTKARSCAKAIVLHVRGYIHRVLQNCRVACQTRIPRRREERGGGREGSAFGKHLNNSDPVCRVIWFYPPYTTSFALYKLSKYHRYHRSPLNARLGEIVADECCRAARPASELNFRKFLRKHVGPTGRARTDDNSGIPTRVGIPSPYLYCPPRTMRRLIAKRPGENLTRK